MEIRARNLLVNKYFEENNFVQSSIESYNSFIDWRLQNLIDEVGFATPAVIPPEAEEVKFQFGKITIEKPSIVEADGAKMLKSKLCYLHGLSREELIAAGEDPYDSGGYFIINGTERTLSLLEDLSSNKIFVAKEKVGPITHSAKLFSASKIYKIPHTLERTKDGLFLLTFAGLKRVPIAILLKSLGFTNDSEIPKLIGLEDVDEDLYLNLFDFVDVKSEEIAQEYIAKLSSMMLTKEQKVQRITYILDNFLLPHIGSNLEDRKKKGYFIGRMIRKLLLLKKGKIRKDDKDHYKRYFIYFPERSKERKSSVNQLNSQNKVANTAN